MLILKFQVDACELAVETIASFIGATHSLRCLSGVTNDDEIISALLKHSKQSLETVVFDRPSSRPKTSTASPHSFESFPRLANIELPQSHLYEPIHPKQSAFDTTDRVDLRSSLPP